PIAIVRRGEHADALRALGAEVLVADANGEDARAQLRALVGPDGARAVFDAVAGETGALALSALRHGGRHVVYGGLSGAPLAVDAGALIFRDVRVEGVWRTRWAAEAPAEAIRRAVGALADLVAEGALALPVEATYDLADWREALAHAAAPGRAGPGDVRPRRWARGAASRGGAGAAREGAADGVARRRRISSRSVREREGPSYGPCIPPSCTLNRRAAGRPAPSGAGERRRH